MPNGLPSLCELAIKFAEDAGVIASHIKHFEPLHIQILVQCLDEHGPGRHKDIEGSGSEGNGRMKLEVHVRYLGPGRIRGSTESGAK